MLGVGCWSGADYGVHEWNWAKNAEFGQRSYVGNYPCSVVFGKEKEKMKFMKIMLDKTEQWC